MTELKCAIFDLDGTLVNTIDDLAIACNTLLDKYGFDAEWSADDYMRFVGDGLRTLVDRAFDHTLDDDTLDSRYAECKRLYDTIKLDHAYAYDGISDQLNILRSRGVKLAVVTNKPHIAAKGMVEHIFGVDTFDIIIGAQDGVPVKPDPTMVRNALDAMGCKPREAIYFGDSEVDIRTARNAGIEAVGCSWGFRDFGTLFKENPSVIIDSPEYIEKLF